MENMDGRPPPKNAVNGPAPDNADPPVTAATVDGIANPGGRCARLARSLRVLVVEDTSFNQTLIRRLLHRWGHRAAIAPNGRQAVDLLSTQSFDLVLMDVLMPEMNGFEATRAIRARERGTGRSIPIVAMTARAMQGDRERCLEAGMDDYISKPITPDELLAVINRLAPPSAPPSRQPPTPPAGRAAAKRQTLMEIFNNDQSFLREAAAMFLADYPPMLAQIRAALAAADAPALRRAAHALKGMTGHFQACRAAHAAGELEQMGRNGCLEKAPETFQVLCRQLDALKSQLLEIV
jgi:CheY-like chemotaxis protein